jgi:hypothetical protein
MYALSELSFRRFFGIGRPKDWRAELFQKISSYLLALGGVLVIYVLIKTT